MQQEDQSQEEVDPSQEEEFDISIFEIPPAAAYFETIQQLQKVNAKLDVLLDALAEIKSGMENRDASAEKALLRRAAAERYDVLLLRYFKEAGIDPEALRSTIHPDDRPDAGDAGTNFRHTPVIP